MLINYWFEISTKNTIANNSKSIGYLDVHLATGQYQPLQLCALSISQCIAKCVKIINIVTSQIQTDKIFEFSLLKSLADLRYFHAGYIE